MRTVVSMLIQQFVENRQLVSNSSGHTHTHTHTHTLALFLSLSLRKVDLKYLGSFEMWCWRRLEKISWTDRVRNEEALQRVKGRRGISYIQ
jgi:hypothetical protein